MEMIKKQVIEAVEELLEVANLKKGDVFVLGASSSEVRGEHIGKGSSEKIGREIISGLLAVLETRGIYLAVQGCEHINRALTIEREAQEAYGFEIVSVKPSLHAGGSCSVSAMDLFKDPVVVEHIVAQAGIDIGDTFIGMHVKHVQVPVRLRVDKVGEAHLTALRSRPKLIGGERATY